VQRTDDSVEQHGNRWRRAYERSPDVPYTGAVGPVTGPRLRPDEFDDEDLVEPLPEGFSGKQAAEIVGITYRQLDYWARTDLVRPSLADVHGHGSRRLYSYRNLLELKAIKTLLDAGIRLESVREVFRYLRDNLGEDVTGVNLVISGKGSVLVRSGEEIVDLLREGQGILNILPMAGVQDEVQSKIVELYPPTGSSSAAEAG
jgi:DNA-binding transcriptional MerR regulator